MPYLDNLCDWKVDCINVSDDFYLYSSRCYDFGMCFGEWMFELLNVLHRDPPSLKACPRNHFSVDSGDYPSIDYPAKNRWKSEFLVSTRLPRLPYANHMGT